MGAADGPARLHALRRPGRRLGRGGHDGARPAWTPSTCAGIHLNMALADPQALDGLGELTEQRAGGARVASPTTSSGTPATPPAVDPAPDRRLRAGRLAGRAVRRGSSRSSGPGPTATAHPENVLTRDELLDNVMLYWLPAAGRVVGAAVLGELPPARLQGRSTCRRASRCSRRRSSASRAAGPKPASATCATSANRPAAGTSRPWSSRSCSWTRCGPPSVASARPLW